MPQSSRTLRKLLIGVAGAIVAVIVIALVAPLVIPSDVIAARIVGLVRQKTGRELRIAGPISFSLLPRLALVAHDVSLSSPEGNFSADFLTAQTVDVALSPRALLHGAVEIDQLRLSHPVIDFEIDKDGRHNWVFHLPRAAGAAAPATTHAAAPSFAAGDLKLTDGEVDYRDDHTGETQSLGNLDMTVSLPSLDGALAANGSATYNGEPVRLAITAAAPGELRDGRASAATLAIVSAHESFDFRGTIDDGQPLGATGTVTLKTPSLRDLLAWARLRIAPEDIALGALSIDGKVDLAGSKLTLGEATIVLGDVTASGTLRLTRADRRYALGFDDLAVNGGKITGTLVADESGPSPAFAATVKVAGITVHQLSFDIAGFNMLSGTGDAAFDLTAKGATMREAVASLNGSAHLDFADGVVGSAGLSPMMKNTLGPAIADKTIPREIAFRTLSGTATIENGVLRNDDLKLSGPQLSATGAGSLDLAPRRIDYLWQPDIAGLGSARIAITGTWDNPEYKVESITVTKGLAIPGLKLR